MEWSIRKSFKGREEKAMKQRSRHASRHPAHPVSTRKETGGYGKQREPVAVHYPVAGGLNLHELLEALAKIPHPVRLDALLQVLDLSRRDKKALEQALEQLQAEGKAYRLRGGKWVEASRVGTITGILSVQRSGAGFVVPDRESEDRLRRGSRDSATLYIHPAFLGGAWHGDRVEAVVQPGREPSRRERRGRGEKASFSHPEGRIIRILERGHKELTVSVTRHQTPRGVLCRPADPRLDFLLDVDVSPLESRPQVGELLVVVPQEQQESGLWNAVARLSLGSEERVEVQERLVKLNHQIPLEFPPDVLAEAAQLNQKAPEIEEATRQSLSAGPFPAPEALPRVPTAEQQDLRGLPFVTIDGDDARDFDDAVFVRQGSGSPEVWELWVAIADVSSFVVPFSALDREARERGNSYYFPASVVPMLPEVLSNHLCSLRPDEDRLVMAARIGFDGQGRPCWAAFFPGVIRSRSRLTYTQVQAALDAENAPLLEEHPALKDAAILARMLHERREQRGSLDFDVPEAAFSLDEHTGEVTGVHTRERLFSHRLIEEFMLAANEAVARFLKEKGTPFPYRVHPAPDPDKVATLFRTLAATGLVVSGSFRPDGKTVSPSQMRSLLHEAKGTPQEYLVNKLVLRSMMQARYSVEPGEHFGLASACYCHFTSPIRRYADLMVHRALRHTLGAASFSIPARQKLLASTELCNARERTAVEAEREITRRLSCLFLLRYVGRAFSGIISGVMDFGFFVELEGMPVEGMVRLGSQASGLRDWFEYNADRQELIGQNTGQRFHLGQPVKVRLTDVHVGRLEINLELLEAGSARPFSSRKQAGKKGFRSPRRRKYGPPSHAR